MALTINVRSLINRLVLLELKAPIRYYSEVSDEPNEEKQKEVDPLKDRTKIIPVETSIKYLQSKAYNQTYGEKPVWFLYRRNHKGGFAPRKTRRTCVRNGIISTGNPCPICRDEYLVLDPRNTGLLVQFISEYTGQAASQMALKIAFAKLRHEGEKTHVIATTPATIPFHRKTAMQHYCLAAEIGIVNKILDAFKTGLCQKQHKELLVAIEKAWDQGYLTYDVPFREYDYSLYYNESVKTN